MSLRVLLQEGRSNLTPLVMPFPRLRESRPPPFLNLSLTRSGRGQGGFKVLSPLEGEIRVRGKNPTVGASATGGLEGHRVVSPAPLHSQPLPQEWKRPHYKEHLFYLSRAICRGLGVLYVSSNLPKK